MQPRPDYETVDAYIAAFPPEVQVLLRRVRETIRAAVPQATERISYKIPAYAFHGVLIYFAGYAKHISVYPAPRGVPAFEPELSRYKGGKGTAQFPLDKPIPYDLVSRIAKHRAKENLAKATPQNRAATA